MSEFNVGDKVYFESKILATEGDDMYLVADRNGSRRFVAEDLTKTKESYNKGLEDAWELARKIVLPSHMGGYTMDEFKNIFGKNTYMSAMSDITPQEALAKVKEYDERNEIKVGDVVRLKATRHESIVTRVTETTIYRLFKDGSCTSEFYKEDFVKTGRHYDSIDEFMKQED